ncbi:MAG: hypothetical protein LAO07_12045, partial [Acidobacteriia bacterium]|nr:hypothetical protein [Terriglobia bacterium]
GGAAASGDVYLGSVVTDTTRVTAVTNATKLYGQVVAAPGIAGSFALAHRLGRVPAGALIQMTSSGAIWYQSSAMYDATNLYLVASDAGVTAKVLLW